MSNVVAAVEQITDAVVTAIVEVGKPVGDHEAPEDTTERYAVVYLITGTLDGSIQNPHEDADLVFQVETYGRGRRQAQHHADDVRRRLLSREIVVDGPWRIREVTLPVVGFPQNEGILPGETMPLFCTREDFHVQASAAPAP